MTMVIARKSDMPTILPQLCLCAKMAYMTLIKNIKDELKEAMRTKDTNRLTVLRGLITGFTNELVASGKTPQDEVTDEIATTIIKRQVKQRKDSIEQFTKGGREDLVEKEEIELSILETYLPAMMTQDAIRPIAEAKKAEMGVTDKSKMGILMGAIMKETAGKADGNDVKVVVESLFV